MDKILYVNIKELASYSTFIVGKGFMQFPLEMKPTFLAPRQFQVKKENTLDYLKLFKEKDFAIYYRFSREEEWNELDKNEYFTFAENGKVIFYNNN